MDQILSQLKNTSSRILLLVFTVMLFSACKKEEKNIELFEAEISGRLYQLKVVNNTSIPWKILFLQGEYEDDDVSINVRLDLCNLEAWPHQTSFPIFKDSCVTSNSAGTNKSFFSIRNKRTRAYEAYVVENDIPDGYSEVNFEEFRGLSSSDYNFKGTYKMRLPLDWFSPPAQPSDTGGISGRFHFKRTPNTQ